MNNTRFPSVYNTQPAEMQEDTQRAFITRVYVWMTYGLAVTGMTALVTSMVPGIMRAILTSQFLFLGLIVGELVLVMALTWAINRISPLVAGLLFSAYAVLNGLTLSVVMLAYTRSSIAVAFGITACMFGIMSLWGFTTRRDLTRMGSILIMALIGMVLASLVNMFFNSPAIYWLTTYALVLIFVGLIAYDTQRLKMMALGVGEDGEVMQRASILGALRLYLDFINLFLLILRILGRRK